MVDEVEFRTWHSADRSTLQTIKLPIADFIDTLCDRLKILKPHNFIAWEQSKFSVQRKNNLVEGEILVQFDFSENYAYVVQDSAQSFHYNNDQCTVHPIVYYYREREEICLRSLVVLSDSLRHDSAAVYVIQDI